MRNYLSGLLIGLRINLTKDLYSVFGYLERFFATWDILET